MLCIIKSRLGIVGNKEDGVLRELLEYAKVFILAYTMRDASQWLNVFEPIQVKITCIEYAKIGAEGVINRTEGDISTGFYGIEDYPHSVTKTLNPYRLAKVVNL